MPVVVHIVDGGSTDETELASHDFNAQWLKQRSNCTTLKSGDVVVSKTIMTFLLPREALY